MRSDFRAIIHDRRTELTARLAAVEAQLAVIREARSGATDDDEHDPEGSTLSMEWSRAAGQREDALRELADLDAASDRLEHGSFGRCLSCGGSIPIGRLRVLPAASLCVPCASAQDR